MDVEVVEVATGVWQARARHVSWALVLDGGDVTLVDTGYPGDRERVVASLERIGRTGSDVAAVVLTHGHPDHLGSAEYFRTEYGARVLVHRDEVDNATGRDIQQATIPALLRQVWRPNVFVWARDIVALGATRVQRLRAVDAYTEQALDVPGNLVPIPTPGHTSGHCALHLPDRGVVLAGDALMTEHAAARRAGPQLLPAFFNHDQAQAQQSLHALVRLDAEVVVPGHGPPFHGTPAAAAHAALAALEGDDASVGTTWQVRLSYGAHLPLTPAEAFAFVSDPHNWPQFFLTMDSVRTEGWHVRGGRAQLITRVVGRSFLSEMELIRWDPPHEFCYVSHQSGAPEMINRRVFEPVAGGTRLRGTSDIAIRAGAAGLRDRALVVALRRMYDAAMARLPEVTSIR